MQPDAGKEFPDDARLDARLTSALNQLPPAPLASNFTARVLQAVDLADAVPSRTPRWNWRFLFPRIAIATAVLLFAGISIQRYETTSHRNLLAKTIAQAASAQPLPSVEALDNFDAIQRMGQSGHADNDLLAWLQ